MNRVKRYSLPIVLAVIALALILVGTLAVTVWRPAQQVVASRDTDQPFTMTRVGVFPLYADTVNVKASAPDDQLVWVAVGAPEDIAAWLQDEPYDEIIGLSDIHTLKAIPHGTETDIQSGAEVATEAESPEEAEADADPMDSPIASDMWVAEKYGRGSVSVTLSEDEMNMSILAATDGTGPAPTITLTWNTPQSNLLALVSFISGAVTALIALFVALALSRSHRRRLARSEELRTLPERATTATSEIEIAPSAVPVEEQEALAEDDAIELGLDESEADSAEDASAADLEPEPSIEEAVAPEAAPADVGDEQFAPDEVTADPTTESEPDREPERLAELEEAQESESIEEPDAHEAPEVTEETEVVDTAAAETEAVEDVESSVQEEIPADVLAQRSETVTTDSGMMNLSALQGGGAFPTRQALREARRRGVTSLVVGQREFKTLPTDSEQSELDRALNERTLQPQKWSEAMGETEEQ